MTGVTELWAGIGGLGLLLGAHLVWTAARAVRAGRAAWARDAALPELQPHRMDGTPPPGVSVIIPAWNDAAMLPGTLRACLDEAGRAGRAITGPVQVMVVAGGDDGSYRRALEAARAERARYPDVTVQVLPQAPLGKNAALNQGLQAAQHDLLVFLDADTTAQPGWLAALTAPLLRGEADAATGHFRPSVPTPISRIFEVQQELAQQVRRRVNLFGGGSIALSRRALERIGGQLPEEVRVGVDFDLTQRLQQAGQRLTYCAGAGVQTEISSTWPEFWRGELRWQAAYLAARRRHLRPAGPSGTGDALRRSLALLYVPGVYAALLTGWLVLPLLALSWLAPSWLAPSWLGRAEVASAGLLTWLAFAVWVLGRHVCACLEVAAYCAQPQVGAVWLRAIPTYAAGFCVSAAACWWALLGQQPVSAHFKGRRSQTQDVQTGTPEVDSKEVAT